MDRGTLPAVTDLQLLNEPTEESFQIHRVYRPGETIPEKVRTKVRKLFFTPETCGGYNIWDIKGIHKLLFNEQQSAQLFNDISSVFVKECGFWFRAYTRPLTRSELKKRVQSNDRDVQIHAMTEISKEDIIGMHAQGVYHGLEVLVDHEVSETKGYVTESRIDREGSLDLLVRPFDNRAGKNLVNHILFYGKRSCSLSHTRFRDEITLNELSVCMRGARPETTLRQVVHIGNEQSTCAVKPRFYQTRIQCNMSKSDNPNIQIPAIKYTIPTAADPVAHQLKTTPFINYTQPNGFTHQQKIVAFRTIMLQQARLKRRNVGYKYRQGTLNSKIPV
jgi:hypothetical protein